ncbi:MAG: stage II sporulation protein M [Pseudomonadota bacterium]
MRKNALLDGRLSLTTPEGIRLLLVPAGPAARAKAWAIDLVLFMGVAWLMALLLAWSKLGQGIYYVLLFVSYWAYPILCEVYGGGRTVGKRAVGIKVLRADGLPVGWRESTLRNLLLVADFLPVFYVAGLFSMLADARFRRLGDIIAATQVVYLDAPPKRAQAAQQTVAPQALPFALTPEQQRTLIDLFEREASLPPERLLELGTLAEALTGHTGEASVARLRAYVAAAEGVKQKQFEAEHAELFEQIRAIQDGSSPAPEALPELYRRLCQCLALCTQRGYSPALADQLQNMVAACHHRLYGSAINRPGTLLRWMLVELPRRVRAEWRLLLLAILGFWGVGIGLGLLVWFQPHWAYSFMSPAELDKMRVMYQPGQMRTGRGGEGDMLMFGFYIWNNVSICFRTFAGGLFAGIPALLSVVYNGMHGGVIAAWLSRDPATRQNFWSFVVTHSSFEITGLLLSAVAGMRLGLTVIRPGRLSRRHALTAASRTIFPVIIGAALLTALAAFFEGFWSANQNIPANVKYAVGAVCWSAVIGFFTFAARERA